jgi:glutamine amidotransferase
MHLLTEGSEEGGLQGLGWIRGRTVRFRLGAEQPLKVPHMGWNEITVRRDAPIVRELLPGSRFYFVHSYHVTCEEESDVAATTDYGYPFPSIVQHENILGTQFHPEKSHKFGMRLLDRFVALN